ncbi:MAG: sugar phosphate isomerase/epimerase [Sedimentisphaerales bacterium]|nr:sugar phosphate isomerase/epimerase [Sedimentisphaerales bacterium]
MKTQSDLSRRQFLQTAALTASTLSLADAPAAQSPSPAPGKPRIGCLSWCFHSLGPAADPEPVLDVIGDLGFDGVELIVTARRDLKDFWTDARIDRLNRKLEQNKLRVSQFVAFQPVVEDLSSTEPAAHERALDYFEATCRIGKKLGAPMVNIVAPWARELKGPTGYLPRYYEVDNPERGEKFHIDIAEDFDWDRVWDAYVETTKACLARAKAHGLKFSIEQHTHCLVPDAASFLRLWDQIRDDDLGYNIDVGWTLLQREYPPVAIHKVGRHLMNAHMRDIDGQMRLFPPFGKGVMDVQAIVATLKRIGFNGYASIEQDMHPGDPDIRDTCREYLRIMRECV